MLFMESYACYCSVRLGVIVVAVLSLIRSVMFSAMVIAHGLDAFYWIMDLAKQDDQLKSSSVTGKMINILHDSSEKALIYWHVVSVINFVSAILAIIGAIKLHKWLILPLAICEFFFFLSSFISHVMLMIMLKKIFNLGLLIVLTLLGSFGVLYVGYNVVACIAMFQIISLVKSTRYRQLYGDDPFHPLLISGGHRKADSVQQLRVLVTPNDMDIDEQKRLAKLGNWPRRHPAPIIAVIPVANMNATPHLKWWQQHDQNMDNRQNDSQVNRNWQRGELLRGAGGAVERKNALNRHYGEQWRGY